MSDRTVEQCERFAEQTGFTGAVAGHFPDLPFPPPPTFKPEELPPPVPRRSAPSLQFAPIPTRVADRVRFFSDRQEKNR